MLEVSKTGFIESGYDERDHILGMPSGGMDIPTECDYSCNIDVVKDQGNSMKCVPYSLCYALETMHNLDGEDIFFDIDEVYNNRENKGEGMMIRDALKFLNKEGYDNGRKISGYARLGSKLIMQYSLLANGPFVMALPVRSTEEDFWNGSDYQGGHAICCVGYDEEGFILMNSWGRGFGYSGKCILPYDQMNNIIEAWTVLA